MRKIKRSNLLSSQKTRIDLQEYGLPASVSLTNQEYDILSRHFGKCLDVTLDKARSMRMG
jgi:hypothetical protein